MYKKDVEQDLKRSTIMFGQFAVEQRESDRYLGQVLHGGSLERVLRPLSRKELDG